MKAVQQIVVTLGERAGFDVVVLLDVSGLLLAASQPGQRAATLAAVVADVLRAAVGVEARLGVDVTGEMAFLAPDGAGGLLCQRFTVDDNDLVLAALVDLSRIDGQTMARAIAQIERAWRL